MSTILLVEDNPHIRKINTQVLTQRGYDLLQTDTVAGCRELMRWNPVDLVVMDIMLPDGSGLELCREIKSRFHIPVLFLTALG
ncbi:MAG TPA: response regulator, partial [Candidatus Anaerofilum excrementigallinarum]|nr:response regulator [Candidatus Anaerofilum excrementigallinarum]